MRWLKYALAVIIALCLFVGGGIFYWFLQKDMPHPNQAFSDSNNTLLATPPKTLEIVRTIETSTKLLPTHFQSNLRFNASASLSTKPSLSSEEKANIHNLFNAILTRVKQDNFCKGGSYSIEPTFEYKDGLRIPKGQSLNASLECEITKEQLPAYNKLLSDLDGMLGDSVTLTIPALQAILQPEEIRAAQEKLSDTLLQLATQKAQDYSNLLQKTCSITQVNFTNFSPIGPIFARSSLMAAAPMSADSANFKAKSYNNALPIVEEDEQKIDATVAFRCY